MTIKIKKITDNQRFMKTKRSFYFSSFLNRKVAGVVPDVGPKVAEIEN